MSVDQPRAIRRKRRPVYRRSAIFLAAVAMVECVVLGAQVMILLVLLTPLWNLGPWLLGMGGFIAATGATIIAYRVLRFAARRRFQFSLRGLLLAVAVIALLIGTLGVRLFGVWNRGRAIRHLAEVGGSVEYGYEDHDSTESGPEWLQARLGYDPFGTVVSADCTTDRAVAALRQHAQQLPDLQHLILVGRAVTDAALENAEGFNRFPKLTLATLVNIRITDAGLQDLRNWTELRGLCINGCSNVTDEGLTDLQDIKCLEELMLVREGSYTMTITDAGLAQVGRSSQLKSLYLIGLPITDAGLVHLENLTKLERLYIKRTKVTEAGLEKVQLALPKCEIIH